MNNNNLPDHNLGAIQVNNGNKQTKQPERTPDEIKKLLETPRKNAFVSIPKAVEIVQQNLDTFFPPGADISALLKKYNAIVSGGFMLWALGLVTQLSDIDIYVNCKHLKDFKTEFKNLIRHPWSLNDAGQFTSSVYCVSFLRKNGIRSVQTFQLKQQRTSHRSLIRNLDIMGVRNKRKPTDVVQNFDLTFCQVWYDGQMVYATHPAHTFAKVGYLQKDYIPTYLQGNKFLQNRMEKYTYRGFTIALDPKGLELTVLDQNPILCKKPDRNLKIKLDGKNISVANDWAFRALLEYIMTGNYFIKTFKGRVDKGTALKNDLPKSFFYNTAYIDGYDSEDYDPPNYINLFTVAKEKAVTIDPTLADNTPEECFYHLASRLLEIMLSPSIHKNPYLKKIIGDYAEENPAYAKRLMNVSNPESAIHYWLPYVRALQTFAKREGEDFAGGEGQLYDFHNHPLEAGITKETLEGYLREKLESHVIKNLNKIPCFWQHSGCTQQLTLDQLRPVISDELVKTLEEFVEEDSLHPSIFNSTVTRGQTFLTNIKTTDPMFGDIYHKAICPFCLVDVERNEGCAYMNHGTYNSIETRKYALASGRYISINFKTPGCSPNEIVDIVRDKYVQAIDTLITNGTLEVYEQAKLEFCVECGRPCVNHQHFTVFEEGDEPGIEPHSKTTPGGAPDYGACDGGGRAELFARILAIRKVLREYTGSDKKELRRLCAIAADGAPLDAALMARAATIAAAAPADRTWGNVDPVNRFNANARRNNENAEHKEDDGDNNSNISSIASNGSVNTVNTNMSENDQIITAENVGEELEKIMDKYDQKIINLHIELDGNEHSREYYLEKIQQYENEIDGNLNGLLQIPNLTDQDRNTIQDYMNSVENQFSTLRTRVNAQFPANQANNSNMNSNNNSNNEIQQGGKRTQKRRGNRKHVASKRYKHRTHKQKRAK